MLQSGSISDKSPDRISAWWIAARPKTLFAAVVPVAVGTAWAWRVADWQALPALLCLGFALLIQIGTNFSNDYFDFIKGADTKDRIGPTRVIAAGLVSHRAMRRAIAIVFAAAFFVGINLVFYGGWWLVVVGLCSICCGLAYTAGPFPLAYNGLGDLFVFAFFGIVAVAFTFYVQTGFFAWEIWLSGAAVGLLATNLLAVNNDRDRETDERARKRTLAVRFGRRFTRGQYAASLVIAGAIPAGFWAAGYGPSILLPLVLAPFGVRLYLRLNAAASAAACAPILERTGFFLLGYGAFFSAGILLS